MQTALLGAATSGTFVECLMNTYQISSNSKIFYQSLKGKLNIKDDTIMAPRY